MCHSHAIAGSEQALGNVEIIYRERIEREFKQRSGIATTEPVKGVCRKIAKLPYGAGE
jgi:hypothetical protein